MLDIKLIVATHKTYKMPDDEMYLPVHVGKENKDELGYIGDNTGEHISSKNPNYCELTGMYWAWKNLEADYIGLAHYRRHFGNKSLITGSIIKKHNNILDSARVKSILENYDAILPKKRKYYIETNFSHYVHAHHKEGLVQTRNVIQKLYPDYVKSFEKIMKRRSAHMFNMLIMKRDIFDKYSKWLFDILFQLEKEIDISHYSTSEARVFGYISELLLDVWLDVNEISYAELPVMFMEKQNWFKKGFSFLKRKVIPGQI